MTTTFRPRSASGPAPNVAPGVTRTDLVVDRIACDGFGMCAELLPELIELDDWGCPVLALRLARTTTAPIERGTAGWHGNQPPSVRR